MDGQYMIRGTVGEQSADTANAEEQPRDLGNTEEQSVDTRSDADALADDLVSIINSPRYKNYDAITAIGKALKDIIPEDEMVKVKQTVVRMMALAIDRGLLDGVLATQQELVEHEKGLLEKARENNRDKERELKSVESDIKRQKKTLAELEEREKEIRQKLESYVGQRIKDVEKDPAIIGARKAYDDIFTRTRDSKGASMAYCCYLKGRGPWDFRDDSDLADEEGCFITPEMTKVTDWRRTF